MMPKKVTDGADRALVRAACESVVINSSAMWGIIPSERYPALRDKYLGDSAHDAMRAVTDRHWRVRRNIKELVRREQERSVSADSGIRQSDFRYNSPDIFGVDGRAVCAARTDAQPGARRTR